MPEWVVVVSADDGRVAAFHKDKIGAGTLPDGVRTATSAEIDAYCAKNDWTRVYLPKADFPGAVAGFSWDMTPEQARAVSGGIIAPGKPPYGTAVATDTAPLDIGLPGFYLVLFFNNTLAEVMINTTLPVGAVAALITKKYGPAFSVVQDWRGPGCDHDTPRAVWIFRFDENHFARIVVTTDCAAAGEKATVFYQSPLAFELRSDEGDRRQHNY